MIKILHKRLLLKTLTWRLLAVISLFAIAWLFSQSLAVATFISLVDFFVKTAFYYLHEYFWDKSIYGLEIDKKEGCVIFLTGLPCSGKTTIALELVRRLEKGLYRIEYLDGDIVRKSICSDLGFSKEDRDENLRRISLLTSYLSHKAITICAFVSPYQKSRDRVRNISKNYLEVFVDCPLEECIRRDVKGMYAKALRGEIKDFTGIDDPYETPKNPDLVCYTGKETVKESTDKIVKLLENKNLI